MQLQGAVMMAKGRKRKSGVKRTPSGRPSRAQEALVEHLPGIERRMRQFGLSEEGARDQKAGTVVGRLRLMGLLSEAEYQAAQRALAIYEAFQRAVKSPSLRPIGTGGAGELGTDDYAAWCARAITAWEGREGVRGVVREASAIHGHRNLYAAVDYLLLRDEDFVHMRGDLQLVLMALVPHFGLTDSEREGVLCA